LQQSLRRAATFLGSEFFHQDREHGAGFLDFEQEAGAEVGKGGDGYGAKDAEGVDGE
jgi:hypothetical protein